MRRVDWCLQSGSAPSTTSCALCVIPESKDLQRSMLHLFFSRSLSANMFAEPAWRGTDVPQIHVQLVHAAFTSH